MVDPIYYKGKFVPFLDEFVSYKGKLFAIAKDEDGLNYTLYQADEFRKRLAIKMKRKIDLKLAMRVCDMGRSAASEETHVRTVKETLYTGLGDRREDNEKAEDDNSIMSVLRS